MGWFEETFGDDPKVYDEYSGTQDTYALFPADTRVLCRVAKVEGRTNKNGKRYPAMELKVIGWGSDLSGSFGSPTLYDNMKLTLPDPPNKYFGQPEDVIKKKQAAAGIWLRQVRALGLKPETMKGDDLVSVEEFFEQAIGHEVLVRVGQEAGATDATTGKTYRAKNTVDSYEPVTDKALDRWKINRAVVAAKAAAVAEEVPF